MDQTDLVHIDEPEELPARSFFSFSRPERDGLLLALKVRTAALLAFVLYILVDRGFADDAPQDLALTAAFIGLGGIQLLLLKRRRLPRIALYAFSTLDVAFLTFFLISEHGVFGDRFPRSFVFRAPVFSFFYLFLVQATLSFQPKLVAWCGASVTVIWGGTALWVSQLPGVYVTPTYQGRPTNQQILDVLADPYFLIVDRVVLQMVVLLIVTGGLTVVVWRSRHLVYRWTAAARERSNLARYFSPRMVDALAGKDQPLGPVRRQCVAALFADIRGFTGLSEAMEPEEVMALLREFHAATEAVIFRHGGTMEKYIGDALFATFGVPNTTGKEASAALRCGRSLLDALLALNGRRVAEGKDALGIGVGVHYGPAVLGDIGTERNMSFAVIGDTTNTASRLQGFTRELDTDLIASQTLVEQVRSEQDGDADELLEGMRYVGSRAIRGRKEPVHVWMIDRGRASSIPDPPVRS